MKASLPQQAEPVAEVRAKSDAYGGTFVQWYSLPVAGMKLYATPQQAQPTGKAPCVRHCEATAFQIEIRELKRALSAAPAVPDGWVMVPNYRGYAALGTGQYLLDISGDANPAELIIHAATEAEKIGRIVGDLLDKRNPGEMIASEKMAVRLAFFSVSGLDALEQQLRILRETHFAAAPGSAPAVQPLTEGDTLVLRLRGRARYLRDVGEHKSAQLLDEAAQRIQPALFCPRCRVDRLKADCPNRIGCPMVADAHGIAAPGSKP